MARSRHPQIPYMAFTSEIRVHAVSPPNREEPCRIATTNGHFPDSRTVLLIDDDSSVRQSLSRVLRAERLEVIATAGGSEALGHLLNPQVALVITDLRMAPIDGWDFLFHVRFGRPRLPVIVLSGVSRQTSGGADRLARGYFQKPVNLDTLLQAIHRQLRLTPSS
jgi:DNA-binding NtrC family response regulator